MFAFKLCPKRETGFVLGILVGQCMIYENVLKSDAVIPIT